MSEGASQELESTAPGANGISIVTDAGVTRGSRGALACVVHVGGRRWKVVALVPDMAPSDAELMAGVLGVVALSALAPGVVPEVWFTDSRAAQSAYARWRSGAPSGCAAFVDAWLMSAPSMREVECRHVSEGRFHGSHDACHRVCTWVQRRGPELLARHGEGPVGLLRETKPDEAWFLVNVSELGENPAKEMARLSAVLTRFVSSESTIL